jgi:hypothetical protein
MKKSELKWPLSLVLCTLMISMSGLGGLQAQDQITLTNPSGNEIGLLVDGASNGSFANDRTYLSPGSPALIGQFSAPKGNQKGEIMAFTQDRPMAIQSGVPWTGGNDNIAVPFADKILIPITIWVVYGDYNTVNQKATSDLLTASAIYTAERLGVDFSTVTIMDATANPKASKYYDYNYYTMGATIRAEIGYTPGQINVYYVRSLDWGGTTLYTNAGEARNENGPWIVLGSAAMTCVLAHEMGHNMALWHVHSGAATQWFDYSNLMSTNGSLKGRLLTEGQILRMHLSSKSVLNNTYHVRPGQLIRDCDPTSTKTTDTCPGVQKRIWADGIYPAN